MSSSSATSTLAAALGAPPAQQLTRANHLAWKALVLPAFRGARVMGLLDGSDSAPPETLETEDSNNKKVTVENPAYSAWVARDQQVLRFLLNSLSPDILSHVLGVETTAEAWSTIDKMFKTAARSKIQLLRSQLNDTPKLGLTADQYFTKMKGFASELAAVGKPLDDDELIGHLVKGLDTRHYNSLITNVNGNPNITLDDFLGQLSSYDMRNPPPEPESTESFSSSANLARRSADRGPQESRGRGGGGGGGDYRDRRDRRDNQYRRDDSRSRNDGGGGDRYRSRDDDRRRNGGNGGKNRPRGRSDRVPTPYVDVTCQICTIHGHDAKDCWWRFQDDNNDDGDRGNSKGAHFASYGVDTNWYSDTGASDHITSELNKLSTHEKYNGRDQVRTAEGTGSGHTKSSV